MRAIHLISALLLVFSYNLSYGWGKTGHRVVGQIAANHLNKKAAKKVKAILGNESLAIVGNYMDFIRADKQYNYMTPWHYCTIPDGQTYDQAGTPEEGDVIATIQRLVRELKSKKFTDFDEAFALKCLVHLVGDIHQPLHVGNGTDRGGNDVKLTYMWEDSNLHRVWDSGMINFEQLSYTEYTQSIDFATESQITEWQAATVVDWAYESVALRSQVYDIPENKKLSYRYSFDNIATVNQRLLQAGVRLAGILNDIYGE